MDQFFRSVASVFTCNILNIYISSRFYLYKADTVPLLGNNIDFPELSLVVPAYYRETLTFEELGRNPLSDLPNPSIFLLFGHTFRVNHITVRVSPGSLFMVRSPPPRAESLKTLGALLSGG